MMLTVTPTTVKNRYYMLATLKSAMQHIDKAKSDLRRVGVDISPIDESRLCIEDMISDVEFREVI